MKKFIRFSAAFLFCIVCASYAHVFSMGISHGEHCAHEQEKHSACIASMSGFSIPHGITFAFPSLFFALALLLGALKVYRQGVFLKVRRVAHAPPLLQLLFSSGILHPKAP